MFIFIVKGVLLLDTLLLQLYFINECDYNGWLPIVVTPFIDSYTYSSY